MRSIPIAFKYGGNVVDEDIDSIVSILSSYPDKDEVAVNLNHNSLTTRGITQLAELIINCSSLPQKVFLMMSSSRLLTVSDFVDLSNKTIPQNVFVYSDEFVVSIETGQVTSNPANGRLMINPEYGRSR